MANNPLGKGFFVYVNDDDTLVRCARQGGAQTCVENDIVQTLRHTQKGKILLTGINAHSRGISVARMRGQ